MEFELQLYVIKTVFFGAFYFDFGNSDAPLGKHLTVLNLKGLNT